MLPDALIAVARREPEHSRRRGDSAVRAGDQATHEWPVTATRLQTVDVMTTLAENGHPRRRRRGPTAEDEVSLDELSPAIACS